MQESTTPALPKPPRKRGPKLASKGPYAVVARKHGISMAQLAVLLAANDHTMRTLDQRGQVRDEHRPLLARLRLAKAGQSMEQLAALLPK